MERLLTHLKDAVMFPSLHRTLLATAISSIAASAWAQETSHLDDMVVTASGFEQQITDAPASISVVSREELERGHYQNVTDALRDVPGVIITGGGAGDNGHDISIRGMPSQYTLILVDGRPQNSVSPGPMVVPGLSKTGCRRYRPLSVLKWCVGQCRRSTAPMPSAVSLT
ncbi:hypothetical protein HSBAA_48880 [Vreelandella sulfidaeris]|uniref:TonB-dependent receptor plug domain-containing protein n=1 Tax=Vreelandella sulfidaeris TaxID=115553 RepID=A0A455UBK5_9GAMM|nr:hypothetical protein HSBAA_48880 [Halomonas sulfidaeris]